MIYTVTGRRVIHEYVVVDAESPQEAAAKFRQMHPGYKPDDVEDADGPGSWEWLGCCEGCGLDLFGGYEYCTAGEGVYLCEKCSNSDQTKGCSDE